MKYKVSVIKKIAFLVMTMALAVAMVACSGAAGTPGPAGPPGKDAPTPDPTTPDPTTPDPTPTGAAPVVALELPDVYLTLAGAGNKKLPDVDLRNHITDADSLLRYTVESSMSTVAEATEKNAMLTVTPMTAGAAMITVTGHDDEGGSSISDVFMVTVVKTNAAPTTNGLSKKDRDSLQKDLYIADGTKPFTVTIISNSGPASDSFEDAIVDDYEIVIGDKAKTTDDHVAVTVKKGAGNKHVINVEPKAGTNGKSVEVKIYPMDKFGAMPSTAWKFKATINTIPEVLTGSLGVIDLSRTGAGTLSATGSIDIGKYFDASTLDRMVHPREAIPNPPLLVQPMVPGDTTCVVNVSPTTNAFHVQKLNTLGLDPTEATAGDDGVQDGNIDGTMLMGSNVLAAIVIDSRRSSYGTPDLYTDTNVLDVITTPTDESAINDTPAIETGSFTLTITCTDPDDAATVTGTVVIRK